MVPPEVYLRAYLTWFGGLAPLDVQARARGKALFDAWDDYLAALGLPDYRIDLPRADAEQHADARDARPARRGAVRARRRARPARQEAAADQRVVFAFDVDAQPSDAEFARALRRPAPHVPRLSRARSRRPIAPIAVLRAVPDGRRRATRQKAHRSAPTRSAGPRCAPRSSSTPKRSSTDADDARVSADARCRRGGARVAAPLWAAPHAATRRRVLRLHPRVRRLGRHAVGRPAQRAQGARRAGVDRQHRHRPAHALEDRRARRRHRHVRDPRAERRHAALRPRHRRALRSARSPDDHQRPRDEHGEPPRRHRVLGDRAPPRRRRARRRRAIDVAIANELGAEQLLPDGRDPVPVVRSSASASIAARSRCASRRAATIAKSLARSDAYLDDADRAAITARARPTRRSELATRSAYPETYERLASQQAALPHLLGDELEAAFTQKALQDAYPQFDYKARVPGAAARSAAAFAVEAMKRNLVRCVGFALGGLDTHNQNYKQHAHTQQELFGVIATLVKLLDATPHPTQRQRSSPITRTSSCSATSAARRRSTSPAGAITIRTTRRS